MEEGLPRFVVLTRPPSDSISFIHDRMPLILPQAQIDQWIDPSADPEHVLGCALSEMSFRAV